MLKRLRDFLKQEAAGGVILMLVAIAAIIFANIPATQVYYAKFLTTTLTIKLGDLGVEKSLLEWINEGLMTIFFLLIGLELKREVLEGALSRFDQVLLPVVAGLGGIIVPALIYLGFNHGNQLNLHGWAIPTTTDIAFALGILSLLKRQVPNSLRIFLLGLAIFDDLVAIIIIAIFYSANILIINLELALLMIALLIVMNRMGVKHVPAYILVGVLLWSCVLKSGVHATLSGVILAFAIPLRDPQDRHNSPLKKLESSLHRWIIFFILPLFSFANAGVILGNFSVQVLGDPVLLGTVLGLLLGKQLGVFSGAYLLIKAKAASLPEHASWRQLWGVAVLCGVGFTMSLFIAMLAFGGENQQTVMIARLGIISGSALSAIFGYILLKFK